MTEAPGPMRTPPTAADYRPPALLANAHVQSVLASSSVRRLIDGRRHHEVLARSTELILDGGDGVRLQGFHAQPDRGQDPRGLAVVFHGWEGSANSAYVLNLSRRLLAEGWEVATRITSTPRSSTRAGSTRWSARSPTSRAAFRRDR
jgi:predicted alpha/beta-fold hydrolase